MMSAHLLEKRFSRALGKIIERGLLNSAPIVIHYVDKPEPDEDYDPNVESTYSDPTEKTVTVTGLVHFVSARTALRQFAEVQAGDVIVTFEGAIYNRDNPEEVVDLSTMTKIRFELAGDIYVQATVGKDLAAYWSTYIGGQILSKTLLLRKPG